MEHNPQSLARNAVILCLGTHETKQEGEAGTHCTVTSSVAVSGAGQEDSLHTTVPMWSLLPWAQPPSPNALDQLQRAGMEPLLQEAFRGLRQGSLVQCLQLSWGQIKSRVWRNTQKMTG